LAKLVGARPEFADRIFGVYGGAPPTDTALKLIPGARGYTRESLQRCLGVYLAFGWSGYVPRSCHGQLIAVPVDYAWLLWGWPNLFQKRMNDAGSEVILVGPLGADGFTSGLDTAEQVSQIPRTFSGYVWTNTVETTGPLIKENRK
jgi:glycerophosphoryl diester phosphodiesterase